jgi:hypothetical protein
VYPVKQCLNLWLVHYTLCYLQMVLSKITHMSQKMPIGICFPEAPDNTPAARREVPDFGGNHTRNPTLGQGSLRRRDRDGQDWP